MNGLHSCFQLQVKSSRINNFDVEDIHKNVNKSIDDLSWGLGLTDKQIDRTDYNTLRCSFAVAQCR